jgi:hypothetical protein
VGQRAVSSDQWPSQWFLGFRDVLAEQQRDMDSAIYFFHLSDHKKIPLVLRYYHFIGRYPYHSERPDIGTSFQKYFHAVATLS